MAFLDFLRRSSPPATPVATPAPQPNAKTLRTITRTRAAALKAADTSRLESSWSVIPVSAEALIYQTWRPTVARSRDQALNNDHGRKFVSMCRENIAGETGLTLQAQAKDPGSDVVDTLASKAIEDAWAKQSEQGNWDVTGTMDRATFERLLVTTLATDGEAIAIIVRGPDAGPMQFALQAMDTMMLNVQHFEKLANGNFIKHGIEFTKLGKPVAYYFIKQEERQIGYVLTQSARNSERVPAEDVIHLFVPEIVGQKRGLPWMRTALWRMRMLAGLEDSAITNARGGAAKMGFFTNEEGEPTDDDEPLEMDAEPGVFEQLPAGYKFEPYDPKYPSEMFDPFSKNILRSIASGLLVSYNNLASDLSSVNFSSIRQGTLDERDVWKALQGFVIGGYAKRAFSAWLESALLRNQITVNGKPLPFTRIDKYKNVIISGRRWPWIDPQADITAYEKAVANGFTSRSAVIRETTGRDPEEVWQEVKRDNEAMDKLEVKPLTPSSYTDPELAQAQLDAKASAPKGSPASK